MDDKTKIAVLVLGVAILISVLGSVAIAFACGYVVATLVNSPQFEKLEIPQKITRFLQSFKSHAVNVPPVSSVTAKSQNPPN